MTRRSLLFLLALPVAAPTAQAQWQPDLRLTTDPDFSTTSFNGVRSVAAGGSALHIAWSDDRDGNREVYYKQSPDEGAHWAADVRLTQDAAASIFPSVAVSGADVHVVWEEYRDGNGEIYSKHSGDGGSTWGSDTRLTANAAKSLSPAAAVSGSVVLVVWFDQRDGNNEIYLKRSGDSGASWGADTRLTIDPASSISPSIAVAGSRVIVAWEEQRDGNREIYVKRSADGGLTWGSDMRLTTDGAASLSPAVSVSGGLVHVVWHDERDGNQEIYDKRSTDAGATWGVDRRLTTHAAASSYASVRVSGANVHVAWFDERDGNTEIYYKQSIDGGTNWTQDARLTTDSARSTDPVVEVTGAVVHVIWTDARDNAPVYTGNYEIYYKRDPAGNPAGAPGAVPDGGDVPGTALLIMKGPSSLTFTWGPACSPAGTDYAVYQGTLGDLASLAPLTCTTGGQVALTVGTENGSRFYLVVPHDEAHEGSYGRDGAHVERVPAVEACRPQLLSACP